MMKTSYLKEACVGTLQESINAEKRGADRIELCANLEVGGTTPSENLIEAAKQKLTIPIRVMIRPRGGDFIYTEEELLEMQAQIQHCKKIGVDAVVFGVLKRDHTLDLENISKLASLAQPLKVVIHKAIDETPDILKATKDLSEIKEIDTILSSGGKATAVEGKGVLREMSEIAKDRLQIMPAGDVSNQNLEILHAAMDAKVYHGKRIVGSLD